jgi:hypothetical protein
MPQCRPPSCAELRGDQEQAAPDRARVLNDQFRLAVYRQDEGMASLAKALELCLPETPYRPRACRTTEA